MRLLCAHALMRSWRTGNAERGRQGARRAGVRGSFTDSQCSTSSGSLLPETTTCCPSRTGTRRTPRPSVTADDHVAALPRLRPGWRARSRGRWRGGRRRTRRARVRRLERSRIARMHIIDGLVVVRFLAQHRQRAPGRLARRGRRGHETRDRRAELRGELDATFHRALARLAGIDGTGGADTNDLRTRTAQPTTGSRRHRCNLGACGLRCIALAQTVGARRARAITATLAHPPPRARSCWYARSSRHLNRKQRRRADPARNRNE